MSGRSGGAALTASPVLVGAVTVLVTIVAVFLSYNANSGLPFVPTYDLKANLPNASQLVEGFEVRIGGARVGLHLGHRAEEAGGRQHLRPGDDEARQGHRAAARRLHAARAAALRARPQVPRGDPRGGPRPGLKPGATIPLRQARPEVVELDDLFSMFDEKARAGVAQLARRLRRRLRGPRPGPERGHRAVASRCCATSSRWRATCPTRAPASTASSARSGVPPPRSRPWPRSRPRCS